MLSSCLGPRRSCCGFVLHQEGLNPVVMLLLADAMDRSRAVDGTGSPKSAFWQWMRELGQS